jgi:tRNA 2-thiouridine synthesizing protein E
MPRAPQTAAAVPGLERTCDPGSGRFPEARIDRWHADLVDRLLRIHEIILLVGAAAVTDDNEVSATEVTAERGEEQRLAWRLADRTRISSLQWVRFVRCGGKRPAAPPLRIVKGALLRRRCVLGISGRMRILSPLSCDEEANMATTTDEIRGREHTPDPHFPHAPADWTRAAALAAANGENLPLGDDHWELLRGLQEFFARHEDVPINLRDLHDALDEKFHHKGGMRYLYTLFPGGPIAQGCRLAGLKAPAGATDRSFGSVA